MKTTIALVLRPGEKNEAVADKLRQMDKRCFPSDEPTDIEDIWWWIVYRGKTPAGYAGLQQTANKTEKTGFLCRAGVLPEHRGHGLHRTLIRARMRYAKQAGMKQLVTYTAIGNYASINGLVDRGFRLYHPDWPWAGKDRTYLLLRF